MFIFKTTTVVESKVCPGVSITVRKMTEDRRDVLRLALAVPLATLQLRGVELRQLEGSKDPQSEARRAEIVAECAEIDGSELVKIKLEWGVKAITGLGIDDDENVATVAEWKKWPSELVVEVVDMVNHASGLSAPEIKNSPLPFTPSSPESPATSDSTAASANVNASTKVEIAEASSPEV